MEPLALGAGMLAMVAFIAVRNYLRNRRHAGARTPLRTSNVSTASYPGDFTGKVNVTYSPRSDGQADPGEIVWTWVPYEEDHSRGKDRPVLLVGRDGKWLLGLQLSSQDHDKDAADEARYGRRWVDIGSGPWDRKGRPSEVRLDRVLRVDPAGVRREGAILDRKLFAKVTDSL
jgi:hypothetical protein